MELTRSLEFITLEKKIWVVEKNVDIPSIYMATEALGKDETAQVYAKSEREACKKGKGRARSKTKFLIIFGDPSVP